MQWYIKCIKNYATFTGRARREEYWMFFLFNLIFGVAIGIIDFLLKTNGLIGGLYSLALLIPGLAATVRRLHDTGRSGGWIFINLVPIVGTIWFLVLLCLSGDPSPNKYGEDPKQVAAPAAV